MKITFEEYENLLDKFDKINIPEYWPLPNDIEVMEKNPDKYIIFAIYLDSRCQSPHNMEQRYSKTNLCNFLIDNLEII